MWDKLDHAKHNMPKNATMRDCIIAGYFTEDEALRMINFNLTSIKQSEIKNGLSGLSWAILGYLFGVGI